MVLFFLSIKAELENVDSVQLRRDVNLCINVRNPLSDFETREKIVLNPSETVEQEEGAREPPYHFGLKWEGSKKISTLTVLDEAAVKTALKKKKGAAGPPTDIGKYTAESSGQWAPLLAVECRGLEPFGFLPIGNGDEFVVMSAGGKVFDQEVDFSEGDWAEYDDENDAPVSLSEIEFKWEAV